MNNLTNPKTNIADNHCFSLLYFFLNVYIEVKWEVNWS